MLFIALLATYIVPAFCLWKTLYDLENGHVYLHLSNNDLIKLDFNISGKDITLEDGSKVETLAAPPKGSSIFMNQNTIYALAGSTSTPTDSSTPINDICGSGNISLKVYNSTTNEWYDLNLDLSYISSDTSYYDEASYLSPIDPTQKNVYVYGGRCSKSNTVSTRLLSIDLDNLKVSNISTSTKPSAFYGAASLIAPDPQNSLLIGGQSSGGGWLNMYQLASWSSSGGWSVKTVREDDSPVVNSRRNALALPIFSPLSNSSVETILNDYRVSAVLLLGGVSNKAISFISKLSMDTNSWTWHNENMTFNPYDVLGAATIFNTLIVVNSTSEASSNDKRDSFNSYVLNLYDVGTFSRVTSVKSNLDAHLHKSGQDDASSSKGSLTQSQKVIVGTIVSISAVVIMAVAAATYMYRKRKNGNSEEDVDYQLGFYNNDNSSTIGQQSMTSWVRKRQEFERQRNHNTSFFESQETLSEVRNDEPISNPFNDESSSPVKETTNSPYIPGYLQYKTLKKSISLKSAYGSLQKKPSSKGQTPKKSPTLFDDEFSCDSDGNESEVDDNLDVQVLVSSKRRSQLRVVNPDLETINSEDEDSVKEKVSQMRQRVPSGPAPEL